ANAVCLYHVTTAGRTTKVGAMNFHKTRGGASRQPAKKIHHPLPAIGSFPGRAATLVVAQQRFSGRSDRHILVITFRFRPAHTPARSDQSLMRPVPDLHTGFDKDK